MQNKQRYESTGEWVSPTQICLSLATGRSKEKSNVSECQAILDLSIFQCVFVDSCMKLNSEKNPNFLHPKGQHAQAVFGL